MKKMKKLESLKTKMYTSELSNLTGGGNQGILYGSTEGYGSFEFAGKKYSGYTSDKHILGIGYGHETTQGWYF